jgi:predicted phosphodiesterase
VRIAVISDVHSNLPALEAVLQKTRELEANVIYCLGDIVGYGPFPNECVELIKAHSAASIKGNHDSGLLGETPIDHFNQYGQAAIRWTKKQITPQNLEYLRGLKTILIENGVTLVHSSPDEPAEWTYVMNWEQAEKNFGAFKTNICFIGHTHVPIVIGEDTTINKFRPGERFIINVGSVGQPRDGNPESAFGLLDTDNKTYMLVRVKYDVQKTATAIQEAKLPAFLGKRLFQGI